MVLLALLTPLLIRTMAAALGVSPSTIQMCRAGKSWQHVGIVAVDGRVVSARELSRRLANA